MFGITLGYHRLLTHRSFKAPRWVERVLATCGTLALQRSPLEWVGHHRMHHAGVDTPKDPHSARQGFWWSHVGWLVFYQPELHDYARLRKFARDIVADPYLDALTPLLVQVASQGALAALLYALGGMPFVTWGVFVRLVVVYHITWLVNSATHKWGYRTYATDDLSTNNWWVAVLAFGEGWHNNHHAAQDVAPAWRRWWELDPTWMVLWAMRGLGLAWDVRMPARELHGLAFGGGHGEGAGRAGARETVGPL
jgi:stearoyl-CoA desaturase (delta-9 desaturase)